MDLLSLLAIAGAFFVVTVSPGPANLGCAAVAVRHGRAVGVRFALGLSLGLGLWGVLAAAGMGAVLQTSERALIVLKLFGAAYLFWLAFGSARAATNSATQADAPGKGRHWFLQGLLLNLSNPKAVFAWMAALAVGLEPSAGPQAVAVATLVCAALGVVNYICWASLFSMPPVMAIYTRVRAWVDGVVAGLFALAGFGLIRSALSR